MFNLTEPTEKPHIRHYPENNRFELALDGNTALLEYTLQTDTIIFTHTLVPPILEGRGLGAQLARAGLEFARGKALKVVPVCWFVAGYIERHPEYQALLKS